MRGSFFEIFRLRPSGNGFLVSSEGRVLELVWGRLGPARGATKPAAHGEEAESASVQRTKVRRSERLRRLAAVR